MEMLEKTRAVESYDAPIHAVGTVMDDGTVLLCKPGAVSLLPSGRDAWVVGSENVVIVDLHGMVDYAKKAG